MHGAITIIVLCILPKPILDSNLTKSRLFIIYFSITLAVWNVAQRTRMALILLCSIQHFNMEEWISKWRRFHEFWFQDGFRRVTFHCNGTISQIPQCTCPISHNSEWCIVGCWTGAFWDLWDWSKAQEDKSSFPVLSTRKLPSHGQNPLVWPKMGISVYDDGKTGIRTLCPQAVPGMQLFHKNRISLNVEKNQSCYNKGGSQIQYTLLFHNSCAPIRTALHMK